MPKLILYFIGALLIGGFFLWLTLKGVDTHLVLETFSNSNGLELAGVCALFVGIYLTSHAARVMRWHELVKPLGAEVPAATVHRVSVVGSAAILLLPLRLGEFVRPYLLVRQTRLTMSAVLGTAVVERVIDGLIMTGLLFLTLATYSPGPGVTRGHTEFAWITGSISAAIFLGALGVCVATMRWRQGTVRVLTRVFSVVSQGLALKLVGMLEAFIDGFKALSQAHALGRFLAMTTLYWVTNVASMWVLARFGFGLEVSLWEMATVLSILVIGIMIPAGPGLAGNFEFFLKRAMGLFIVLDALEPVVVAFAALLHVLQLGCIVLPGLLVMWKYPEMRGLWSMAQRAQHEVEEQAQSPSPPASTPP